MDRYRKTVFGGGSILKNYIFQASFILGILLFIVDPVFSAEKKWFPVDVDVWNPPYNKARQREQKKYIPLEKAQKKWHLRVFIPHLKDAYWLGVNYGLIDEARRLGISLTIYQAGGYGQLTVQRNQINSVLSNSAQKTDGLIICAISETGLNDIVKKAAEIKIPVLDLINGMSSTHISARAAVSYWDTGFQAGIYLSRIQQKMKKRLSIAWFPGPEGAGWVTAGDRGFRDAIKGHDVKILTSQRADTGSAAQGKLVQTALDRYGERLDFIIGTTVTAETAVKIIRQLGFKNKVQVLSYYYSPGVHRGIRRRNIVAAPSDHQVLQARIGIDTLVRIIEKKSYFKHVAPRVTVVDQNNIQSWDSSTTLAPRGFRPVVSINE